MARVTCKSCGAEVRLQGIAGICPQCDALVMTTPDSPNTDNLLVNEGKFERPPEGNVDTYPFHPTGKEMMAGKVDPDAPVDLLGSPANPVEAIDPGNPTQPD